MKIGFTSQELLCGAEKKAGVEYLYDIKNVLSTLCALTFALFGLAKI
jgi:hypothetical protein